MIRTITDVACTVCGCVCDDLTIHVERDIIVKAERACPLAEPWFLSQNQSSAPRVLIEGRPFDRETAMVRAVGLLRSSRYPLIYGLSRSTTEGQRAAVALAEYLGATIDTTAATGHAPSLMALQEVGESTCSLGEVKNRSDLVIFWGCDPAVTHPRHTERYAPDPVGMFVPEGRRGRHVVYAGSQPTEMPPDADTVLKIAPGMDFEAFQTLRCLVRGIPLSPESPVGADLTALKELAARMKGCRNGILFFGSSPSNVAAGHRVIESMLRLVTELNDFTRFYARRMRRFGDVAGADSVLTWQTGYPFGVNFARRYPRYNPGEYSAPKMLERRQPDLALLLGSDTVSEFPPGALAHLRTIPIIALEMPTTRSRIPPTIRFTTAVYGVHRQGTAYRMDEIPIPLKVLLPGDYPSDGEILGEMLERLRGGK